MSKSKNASASVSEAPAQTTIVIPQPRIEVCEIAVVGVTPLITHKWSWKSKIIIEGDVTGKPRGKKAPKDPEAEFNEARYVATEGWDGVQAVGFKAAMVGAARQCEGLTMTDAKRLFFVVPDGYDEEGNGLTRIIGEPRLHRAMVRVGMGSADIRYRPIYSPWRAVVRVQFNAGIISAQHVAHLLQIAGSSEGIGEWRPSSPKSATGTFGCFTIEGLK